MSVNHLNCDSRGGAVYFYATSIHKDGRQARDLNKDNQISESEFSSNTTNEGLMFAGLSAYRGNKNYEMSNHLGNVLTVISDKKLITCTSNTFNGYSADVISATDYSPFGAPMAGRTYSSEEYRYGFNGQEKDNEVSGAGNTMTAEFWEYDARLGRRFNIDPKPFPFISVYACFTNDPVLYTDITGAVIDGDIEKVEEVKESSKSHIQSLNMRIEELDKRIENRKAKGKIVANEICEKRRLKREIAKYQQVLDEISIMEQDQTTQFYIITDNSRLSGETNHDGELKQRVNIITTGSVEITAHELKHGFQFLMGEASYRKGGVNGGLNDINDEVEGYKRQALFGPLPFEGPINSTNVRNIWSEGKQPYLTLPEANLNNSSTVKQVYSAHNLPIPSEINGNSLYKNYATGEYFK